jgi:hypothetical protein
VISYLSRDVDEVGRDVVRSGEFINLKLGTECSILKCCLKPDLGNANNGKVVFKNYK